MKLITALVTALAAVLGLGVSSATPSAPSWGFGTTMASWVDSVSYPIGTLNTGSLQLTGYEPLQIVRRVGTAPQRQEVVFRGYVTTELIGDQLTADLTVHWTDRDAPDGFEYETTLIVGGEVLCHPSVMADNCLEPKTIPNIENGRRVEVEMRVVVHWNINTAYVDVGQLSVTLQQTAQGQPLAGGWHHTVTFQYDERIDFAPQPPEQPICEVAPPMPPDGSIPVLWSARPPMPGQWVFYNCRTFQSIDFATGAPAVANPWIRPGAGYGNWHELGRLVLTLADGTEVREWTYSGRFTIGQIVFFEGAFYRFNGRAQYPDVVTAPRTFNPRDYTWAGWTLWEPPSDALLPPAADLPQIEDEVLPPLDLPEIEQPETQPDLQPQPEQDGETGIEPDLDVRELTEA